MEKQKLYRYTNYLASAGVDEWGNSLGSRQALYCIPYTIIKETKCGYWVMDGRKRFVYKDARKKFACLDKLTALESFIARKKRQIKILKAQINSVHEALYLAKKEQEKL